MTANREETVGSIRILKRKKRDKLQRCYIISTNEYNIVKKISSEINARHICSKFTADSQVNMKFDDTAIILFKQDNKKNLI